jgi:hypothetical protein
MPKTEHVWLTIAIAILFFIGMSKSGAVQAATDPVWIRDLNIPRITFAGDVVTDLLGNVYINGDTDGLIGQSESGGYDSFLIKYDAAGTKIWARQFGSSLHEGTTGLAVDPFGNVVTSGYTEGALEGPDLGAWDSFIRKYDGSGNVLWTRQFGSAAFDAARGVATDNLGNVYATGYVHASLGITKGDVFVQKYDPAGNLAWEGLLTGAADDYAYKIGVDSLGNSYVCGSTDGSLSGPHFGGEDAFVSKFGPSGTPLWTRQFGTASQDNAFDIAVDPLGNSYVGGRMDGLAFLRKYDPFGNSVWTHSFGFQSASSVSLDGLGNVFVSGSYGSTSNNPFVARFSTEGVQKWIGFPDVLEGPYTPVIAADGLGSLYALNSTWFGENLGIRLVKLEVIPEPSTCMLSAMPLISAWAVGRRRGVSFRRD